MSWIWEVKGKGREGNWKLCLLFHIATFVRAGFRQQQSTLTLTMQTNHVTYICYFKMKNQRPLRKEAWWKVSSLRSRPCSCFLHLQCLAKSQKHLYYWHECDWLIKEYFQRPKFCLMCIDQENGSYMSAQGWRSFLMTRKTLSVPSEFSFPRN